MLFYAIGRVMLVMPVNNDKQRGGPTLPVGGIMLRLSALSRYRLAMLSRGATLNAGKLGCMTCRGVRLALLAMVVILHGGKWNLFQRTRSGGEISPHTKHSKSKDKETRGEETGRGGQGEKEEEEEEQEHEEGRGRVDARRKRGLRLGSVLSPQCHSRFCTVSCIFCAGRPYS